MIKGLDIFQIGLRKFNIKCIINNRNIATSCKNVVFSHTFPKCPSTNILYIINPKRGICDLTQSNANFLFFSSVSDIDKSQIGTNSNIIIVPENTDYEDLITTACDCCQAIEIIEKYSSSLLDSIASDQELSALLDLISEILGNPVTIYDINADCFLTPSKQKITYDTRWDNLVLYGNSPYTDQATQNLMRFSIAEYFHGSKYPVLFSQDNEKRQLGAGIWIHDVCQYGFVVLEHQKSFSNVDFILVECIVELLRYVLTAKNSSGRYTHKKDSLFSFFEDTVSGHMTDNLILRRAERLGLEFSNDNFLVLLFNRFKDSSYIELMNFAQETKDAFLDKPVTVHNYQIALFFNGNNYEQIVERVNAFLSKANKSSDHSRWCGSISLPYHSACEIGKAYTQCKAASKLGITASDQVLFDYGVYIKQHMLLTCAEHFNLADYKMPLAEEMLKYDEDNQTNYALTFYQYLKCFKDTRMVADILNIHRNTVVYRIDRAVELFHIDLKNVTLLSNLQLSFDIIALSNDALNV